MSTSCGVRALIIYGGVIYRFEVRFAQQEGHFDRQVVLIPVVLLWSHQSEFCIAWCSSSLITLIASFPLCPEQEELGSRWML